MALQYVGGKTASIVGSTATVTNVSLTDLTGGLASSPAEGDFVLVAYATHSTADRSIGVTTSGYAEIAELYANDSRDVNLSVSWKIMGPTPDSAVDISATGATADPGAVAIHVWRGVDAATSLDVTSTTSTGLDSWVPNPPSITPVTSGAVVIAVGAGAGGSGTTVIGDLSSSELSNFQTVSYVLSTRSIGIGVGSIAWSSGALDPAAFAVSGNNSVSNSSAAVTLALRPAAESGGGGSISASGSGTIGLTGSGAATVAITGAASGIIDLAGTGMASGPSSGAASSLTFLEGRADPANASTYTFTSVSLGDEAATRKVAVAVAWRSAGTTNNITAVTVAGASATEVVSGRNTGGSNISAVAIWIADVPTGATGSVVVSLSAEAVRLGIAAYSLVGVETLRDTSTVLPASVGAQTLSDSFTLPSAAHVIGVTFNGAGQSWISAAHADLASGEQSFSVANATTNSTWTGLVEDYDAVLEGTNASYSAAAFAAWDVVEVSGAEEITATASGTLDLSGSGAATVAVSAAASGSIALTGSGAASAAVAATGAGSVSLAGSGAAAVAVSGAGSGEIALGGTGTAESVSGLTATGAGTFDISGSGAASVGILAAVSGTLAITGAGTATIASTAVASGNLSLVGAGTGIIRVAGTGSGAIALSGNGSAAVEISASGSGQIELSGSGTAGAQDNLSAAGAGTIDLAGSGAASVRVAATGAGSITVAGSGAATVKVLQQLPEASRLAAPAQALLPSQQSAKARCLSPERAPCSCWSPSPQAHPALSVTSASRARQGP